MPKPILRATSWAGTQPEEVSILAKVIFGKDIPVTEVERQGNNRVTPENIKEGL